jgi:hypothetical protein
MPTSAAPPPLQLRHQRRNTVISPATIPEQRLVNITVQVTAVAGITNKHADQTPVGTTNLGLNDGDGGRTEQRGQPELRPSSTNTSIMRPPAPPPPASWISNMGHRR